MTSSPAHRSKPLLLLFFCCLAATAWLSLPAPASAQDWEVERDDFEAKKIERYKQLVNRSAEESYAFKQLMRTVGRGPAYDKLVAEYQAKVDADPNNYIWRMLLGHMLRHGGRLDAALASYQFAATLQQNALVFESIGIVQEANRDLDPAVEAYEKALSLSKDRDQKERLLRALGAMALHRRHLDKAKNYFAQLVDLDPRSIFLRKELAQLLVENKLFDEALLQLQEADRLAGRNLQVKTQLMLDIGDVYEKQGKDDKAIEVYRDAAKKVSSGSWLQNEVEERIIGIYRRQNELHALVDYYLETWTSPSFDQLMILARLHEEMGESERALSFVRSAIRAQPSNADARLRLIQVLERKGDVSAVIDAYRDLIKALPRDPNYRFELADIQYRNQDKNGALKTLDELSRAFPRDTSVHLKLADKYLSWEQNDKALAIYKLLIKLDPKNASYVQNLGDFYFQTGQRDLALETWKKIPQVVRDEAEANQILGRIYADHGMHDEAIAAYQKSIDKDPTNCSYQRDMAESYERLRRFNDAVNTWLIIGEKCDDKLLKREARAHVINIYAQQGTLRANLNQYQRAFEREVPDPEAGYFLAEAYLKLKEVDEAIAILHQLVAHHPKDIDALLALEKAYIEIGNIEATLPLLERLAEADPLRNRIYLQKIADAHLKLGDPAMAEEAILASLRVNANDARAYAKLGDIYRKKKHFAKAAEAYEEALAVDPRAFENYFVLADIYIQLNRDMDADQLHRIVVTQAMDDNMILRAARRALDYNAYAGTLESLEQAFSPMLRRIPPKAIYGQIMVELYAAMAQDLIAKTRAGDAREAAVARQSLHDIGRRAIKPLLDAMADDQGATRNLALDLLAEMGNPNAAPAMANLMKDPNRKVQVRAALALARLRAPRAVPYLVEATSHTFDRRIREISTWGLGFIDAPEARQALLDLSGTNFISIRTLAAIGLGRHKTGQDVLLRLVKSDPSPNVRAAAAWALGNMNAIQAIDPLLNMLREEDAFSAAVAAWSLGAMGDARTVEALIDTYWSNQPAARQAAAFALRRIVTAHVDAPRPILWEANAAFLDINNDSSNFNTIGLLGEILQSEFDSVDDTDPTPLLKTHAQEFIKVARRKLNDDRPELRLQVLQDLDGVPSALALQRLSPETDEPWAALATIVTDLAPELRQSLQSEVTAQRWHAASLLGKIADSQAVPDLIQALGSDPSDDVKMQAALALGRSKDPRALTPLQNALSAQNFATRGYAAWALGLLAASTSFDLLSDALADTFPYVAAMAARGLGHLGDARAIPALKKAFPQQPDSVQIEIAQALIRLGARNDVLELPYQHNPGLRRLLEATSP